jgi:hypothetical protein
MLLRLVTAAALLLGNSLPLSAIEGNSTAGPIGGTDIRSALLPPPGLYGGMILLHADGWNFFDGTGQPVAALGGLQIRAERAAGFLVYVPEVEIFGGNVGMIGVAAGGQQCGHLFANTKKHCTWGLTDPYIEAAWSRYFGTLRPSRYSGALPIREGLTVETGFGAVLPLGTYDAIVATTQGLTHGHNIWVFAPSVAATYITRPILGEGTEFSAKFYWNNYLPNPATQYATGTLLDLDFAVSEHIGRWQIGLAGYYVTQIADDKIAGVRLAPDGRRATILALGGVLAYDMPEHGTSMKLKGLTTAITDNTVASYSIVFSIAKKLH